MDSNQCGSDRIQIHITVRNTNAKSYQAAVNVEPPVADKVLLVEQGPVGAQEVVLYEAGGRARADVVHLAVRLGVRIVPRDL